MAVTESELPPDVIMEITAPRGSMRLKLIEPSPVKRNKMIVTFPKQQLQCDAIKLFMKEHYED